MELLARHYGLEQPIRLSIQNGRITGIDPLPGDHPQLPFIAPGLFDLQINGFGGIWFSDEMLTVDQVLEVLQAHYAHGITRLCPTLITSSYAALAHGFATIRAACEAERWADRMVAGCHLEGPYISSEDGPRGAHPLQHVRGCDLQEFFKLQEISGHRIRLLTLAPEVPAAVDFTRALSQQGVTVSIGHTAADSAQIAAVVDAGARLSTHLGNGAHGMIRRHPNCIWDQLAEPRLSASIITDGHHLPASVVRTILLAKGPRRLIVTCDASGLAGCPPGLYDCQGSQFEVLPEGKIVIAGQRQLLAGSAVQTERCVAQLIAMTGLPLHTAWNMASRNPARLLNCPAASLSPGSAAELVLFQCDEQSSTIRILRTIVGNEIVFDANLI